MQKLTRETLKIFWQHAKRYKGAMVALVVGLLIVTAINVGRPFIYRELFNTMIGDGTNKLPELYRLVVYIFAFGLVGQFTWRIMGHINAFFQPRVMSDLLNTCYEYLAKHSIGFFNNNFVGSIVTRVRRYQKAFEDIADQLFWNLGQTFLRVVVIFVVLFFHLWPLGLMVFAWSVVYILFAYFFARYKLKYDIVRANQDTATTAHIADTITNSINLKLFTARDLEVKSFRGITQKLFELRRFAWRLGNVGEIFQGVLMIGLEFGLLYFAVGYWQEGRLTVGDFALLQAYMVQIFDHLWDVGRYIRSAYESLADANEMTEMLLEPHEIVDRPGAVKIQVKAGTINFQDVGFYYNEKVPVLRKFNLQVAAGERVAFVGPSGGGKSTIVKLLFRFLDIQQGKIEIDGQDIAAVTQDSLHSHISLVPQEPILFHRSLLENIRYGRPGAKEAEVIAAAKAAHCHEFISKFPEGYKTLVGERGVKLSGGERQRVAIARAILKNAPILVLDEATSSLDSESEHYIQDALLTLMQGKTTIVIAHRLSTIMAMDRIVVIDKGRIVEQGKHEELVKAKQGTYQKLWQIQAGGFAE